MKRNTDQTPICEQALLRSRSTRASEHSDVDNEVNRKTVLGRKPVFQRIGIFVVLLLICGCTSFDLSKRIPWMDTDAEIKNPTRMTVLWSNTVLAEQGKRGVRGFGARVMFHGKEHEKPARVKGTLTVYAFDVTTRSSSVPDRKFVFTPEQFATHYSMSKLGHSYSIWLPWDEVGGEPRKINLMARFESEEGSGMIMSEDSLQILPGITPDAPNELKTDGEGSHGVVQAGYEQHSTLPTVKKTPLRTTLTDSEPIDLPPSFSRRLGPQEPFSPSTRENPNRSTDKPDGSPTTNDRATSQYAPPYEQLKERQQQIADRFGRKRSPVRKASSVRSNLAAPPNQPHPRDEPSRPLPSKSLEPKDPFDAVDPIEPGVSR